MCLHTLEDFLRDYPQESETEARAAAAKMVAAFPDIDRDRLGEALVLCRARDTEELWFLHRVEVAHYWEGFVRRAAITMALEHPELGLREAASWYLHNMGPTEMMLIEARKRWKGDDNTAAFVAKTLELAFQLGQGLLEMAAAAADPEDVN